MKISVFFFGILYWIFSISAPHFLFTLSKLLLLVAGDALPLQITNLLIPQTARVARFGRMCQKSGWLVRKFIVLLFYSAKKLWTNCLRCFFGAKVFLLFEKLAILSLFVRLYLIELFFLVYDRQFCWFMSLNIHMFDVFVEMN